MWAAPTRSSCNPTGKRSQAGWRGVVGRIGAFNPSIHGFMDTWHERGAATPALRHGSATIRWTPPANNAWRRPTSTPAVMDVIG